MTRCPRCGAVMPHHALGCSWPAPLPGEAGHRRQIVITIEVDPADDLTSFAVPIGQDPTPATWPSGEMILVDGHVTSVFEADRLPDDWCGAAIFAEPIDGTSP